MEGLGWSLSRAVAGAQAREWEQWAAELSEVVDGLAPGLFGTGEAHRATQPFLRELAREGERRITSAHDLGGGLRSWSADSARVDGEVSRAVGVLLARVVTEVAR